MAETGTITNKGAQMFNEHYLSLTHRIMLCGAKVSYISGSPERSTLEELKGLDELQGDVYPQGGSIIDIIDVSAQVYRDNPAVQATVLLNKSISGLENIDKIHEIGIYAQLCQNNPPDYNADYSYRAGDIVRSASRDIYRSLKNNNAEPLTDGTAWLELPRPLAEQTLTNQRWYPVLGSEGKPFLFYIVAKHDYPLCLSYNLTIRYSLNIQLSGDDEVKNIYLSPEDMHGFPEVQLAYLENISQAMRAARDEQRIGQVAIHSLLGEYRSGAYKKGSIVRKSGILWRAVADLSAAESVGFGSGNGFTKDGAVPQLQAVTDKHTWHPLTREMINLIDTYDADRVYSNSDIVVWRGRIWWRQGFDPTKGAEPGVTRYDTAGNKDVKASFWPWWDLLKFPENKVYQ